MTGHLKEFTDVGTAAAFVLTLASGKLVSIASHGPGSVLVGYTD